MMKMTIEEHRELRDYLHTLMRLDEQGIKVKREINDVVTTIHEDLFGDNQYIVVRDIQQEEHPPTVHYCDNAEDVKLYLNSYEGTVLSRCLTVAKVTKRFDKHEADA